MRSRCQSRNEHGTTSQAPEGTKTRGGQTMHCAPCKSQRKSQKRLEPKWLGGHHVLEEVASCRHDTLDFVLSVRTLEALHRQHNTLVFLSRRRSGKKNLRASHNRASSHRYSTGSTPLFWRPTCPVRQKSSRKRTSTCRGTAEHILQHASGVSAATVYMTVNTYQYNSRAEREDQWSTSCNMWRV